MLGKLKPSSKLKSLHPPLPTAFPELLSYMSKGIKVIISQLQLLK